jgi:uncharacterized protein YjbI with pentapeptide repeats
MASVHRRKSRLSNIWLNFASVVVLALLVFIGALTYLGYDITMRIPAAAERNARLEVVRIALIVVGGLGGAVALVVAYRRQRVLEDNNLREEEASERERERLFNERFATASAQLGHDAAAVRIAGVYALASLADEWTKQRRTCVEILCAYLRMPYRRDGSDPGEKEVRLSIIRVISDHLREAMDESRRWQDMELDFTGATFDGGDFSGATFGGATVSFADAAFLGDVSFDRVTFASGTISFEGAQFMDGTVSFAASMLGGASVSLRRSVIDGGHASFYGATIAGSVLSFDVCRLAGGQLSFDELILLSGTLSFDDARFVGTQVSFNRAELRGGLLSLSLIELVAGSVPFDGAVFEGVTVVCDGASTSGGVIDVSAVRRGAIPPCLVDLAAQGVVVLPTGA